MLGGIFSVTEIETGTVISVILLPQEGEDRCGYFYVQIICAKAFAWMWSTSDHITAVATDWS